MLVLSKRRKKLCRQDKSGHAHHKSSSVYLVKDTSRGSKDDEKLPKCFNPKCNGNHLVKNCPNTSEEMKNKLLTELYAKVKDSRLDRKKNMMHGKSSQNSSLFRGIFCDNISAVVMADNGSDDILMQPHVLRAIISASPDTLVFELDFSIEFKMAVSSKPGQEKYTIVCHQSVRASVRLNPLPKKCHLGRTF